MATSCCLAFTILIEAHQIPVEIERGRYRGDDLLLELQVGGLHVVFLHADVAAVDGGAEAVEQILRDLRSISPLVNGFRLY